jgi:hypothetical protein
MTTNLTHGQHGLHTATTDIMLAQQVNTTVAGAVTCLPQNQCISQTDTVAWLPVALTMSGHSPLDAMTIDVTDLVTALRSLSTEEATLLRDSSAGPASTLSATIQLLRDMLQPGKHSDKNTQRTSVSIPATGCRRSIRSAHSCCRALRATSKGGHRPTVGPYRTLGIPTN